MEKYKSTLSFEVAKSLATRLRHGNAVVITDSPHGMLSAVRKAWLRQIRKLLRERSSTVDAATLAHISVEIAERQSIEFTNALPTYDLTSVRVCPLDDFIELATACATMYILSPITARQWAILSKVLSPGCVVVKYNIGGPNE